MRSRLTTINDRKSNCFNLLTGTWGKFYDAADAMAIFIASQQLLHQTVNVLDMLYSRFFDQSARAHSGTVMVYENAIADVNGSFVHFVRSA